MFPSSSRVKLNRVALKHEVGQKLVPRRRRFVESPSNLKLEPRKQEESPDVSEVLSVTDANSSDILTDQTGPEKVMHRSSNAAGGEPETCVGTQKAKRQKYDQSCKELKPEGPFTRGKYHQSKPNTRSKVKLDQLRKLCNLRLRFTWCFCTESESALLKSTQVHRQVKPRGKIAKMSCETRPSSEAAPGRKGQKRADFKAGAGKSSGRRCQLRRRDFYSKTLTTHGAKSCRDRSGKGQSKGKARSTGYDPQPAAAETGPVGTGAASVPAGLSNNKNAQPSSTGLAYSEGSLRRAIGASCCGLCGDCNYVSPQQKTLCWQGQQNSSSEPEQSAAEFKLQTANPKTEASKKIVVWIDQYPKVTLCNVAQYCDACSHNCGFVLSDVFETNAVRCFKQDMRAGFRFWPRCVGHDKHKSEECALAKSCESMFEIQCEESVSQSLSEDQRKMKERPDAETLSGHTTCHFVESWTTEASATCSASFLEGNCTNKGEYRTRMWDRDVEKGDLGPRVEVHGDKRIRLGDNSNGSLASTSESIVKTGSVDKEKMCCWMSDHSHSCLELTFGSCSSFGSAVKGNGVHMKPCSEIGEPRKTAAAPMVSEVFCEGSEMDTDDPESFTCQRVRAYFRKINISCARTYMPWPFSNSGCTLTANASPTACPADSSLVNQPGTLSSQIKAPTDNSSDTTNQASHQSEEKQENGNGENILNERNRKRHCHMSSNSPDSTEAEGKLPSGLSDPAILSTPSQCGSRPHTATVNGPETNSSISTPSQSALGLSDWETASTLSPMSSPFTHGGLSSLSAAPTSLPLSSFLLKKVKGVELADAHSTSASPTSPSFMLKAVEKLQMFQTSFRSDSSNSCESSLILPQDEQQSDEGDFSDRSPPKLEPYYNTSPIKHECNVPMENCVENSSNEFMWLPLLSPITSPQQHSQTRAVPRSQGCSEEEEVNKTLPAHRMPQIGNGSHQSCVENTEHQQHGELNGILLNFKTLSPPSSVKDMNDSNEEESQNESDYENDVEECNSSSEQDPSSPQVTTPLTSGVLTEPNSFPSSDEGNDEVSNDEGQPRFTEEELSCLSETASHEGDTAETAGEPQPGVLDEFTAYEQDILLVDVIQDDPELFEDLPEHGLLKLGPTRVSEAPSTRPAEVMKTLSPRIDRTSLEFEKRLIPVNVDSCCDSSDITEERDSRPWRPQCSKMPNTCLATDKQTRNMVQLDANNNHVSGGLERSQPIQTVQSNSSYNIIPLTSIRNGPRITNLANLADFRRQKSNAYCRQYFSESLACGFKMCRFQHVPVDGDEKFCVETVLRFTKNPICLQKAGAVFTGYYQNNPPGVYFSMPVLLSLLWALLKAGMVSDVFSVLSVSLAHKIMPGHEFLLALFNVVREKGLMGFVPELMQLTSKMASAGLVLSLDCLDCVKNTPESQHTIHPASPASVLSTSGPFAEYLNLAPSIVEIELCTKQEDWRRMGEVFMSICQYSQHPNQVERISGRVAIALLSETKDKLSLPFAVFAETVCQSDGEDGLIRSFLGRIGVSLMLRYHKTHQWAKGRKVVEVLSMSKVSYSTLKGLFGNEDGASRCCLVTVAAELFLLSGSVEGALNALRENNWFLSSCSWPCEPADLESRCRVLMRLVEKTSHRDTLEVLCNLPGIKEPNDMMDTSRYNSLFNSHLQVCVDRQILPVASDTADFMFSKNLAVDHRVLQILLHKLGKQNLWLRAREVFRHSLSVGYYQGVSAPAGFMSLIVPCHLGEVELALAFEMFITVNATAILQMPESSTSTLSITLKRTQSCESEYLSAGSRLLSAACIPQPKLTVHYTTVNASQEQLFTLDISSARRWLRHNHLWANDVWMQ